MAMQIVTAIASLAIGVVVARTLGPEGKGTLSIVQQSVAVLLVLGDLGIGLSAIYYIARREVRAGIVLGNALVVLGAVTAVAGITLTLMLRSPWAIIELPMAYVGASTVLFATSLMAVWIGSIAVGLEGIRGQAMNAIAAAIASLLLVIAFWFLGWRTPFNVLVASAVGAAIGIALTLTMIGPMLGRVRPSIETFSRMVHYSARLHIATAAALLLSRQDILMLGWFLGSSAVGIYSVAASMSELACRLPSAFADAIVAKASRISQEEALDGSARVMRVATLLTVVILAAMAIVMPVVVPLVFGAAFAAASAIFYMLVPGIFAKALIYAVSSYQTARGWVYWRVSIVSVVFNAVLGLLLIPRIGYFGAAAASSVSHVVLFALLMRHLCHDTHRSWTFFLAPTRDDIRFTMRSARAYLKAHGARQGA